MPRWERRHCTLPEGAGSAKNEVEVKERGGGHRGLDRSGGRSGAKYMVMEGRRQAPRGLEEEGGGREGETPGIGGVVVLCRWDGKTREEE